MPRTHLSASLDRQPVAVVCGQSLPRRQPLCFSPDPRKTTCLACRRHPLWRQARAAFPPDPPRLVHTCPWSRPCRACGE